MRVSFTTFPLSENHFAVSKMSSSNVDWRTLITLRIYAQLGIEVDSLKKGLAFPFFLTKITASPLVGLFCSLNKQCADQEHVSVLVREIDKKNQKKWKWLLIKAYAKKNSLLWCYSDTLRLFIYFWTKRQRRQEENGVSRSISYFLLLW